MIGSLSLVAVAADPTPTQAVRAGLPGAVGRVAAAWLAALRSSPAREDAATRDSGKARRRTAAVESVVVAAAGLAAAQRVPEEEAAATSTGYPPAAPSPAAAT